MNVWIVNHYAIPPDEPGEIRHYALAKALIERGHRATVIASTHVHMGGGKQTRLNSGESYRVETVAGVPFLWLRSKPYSGTASRMYNMVEFALRLQFGGSTRHLDRPDIIIGSTLTLFAAYSSCRIAKRLKAPFLLEVRDVWPQTLIDFGMSRWNPGVILFGILERYLYRNADAVICLLPGAAEHIRENGARNQEIVWLPNGIEFAITPPLTDPQEAVPFRVMFAGSHSQANSPRTLLQAASILKQRGRHDIEVHFIGDGPMKREMQNEVAEHGLRNVIFHNPVPKREIYQHLSKAGAVVALLQNKPLYRFGISLNKLFDYMCAARPVLFSGWSVNNPVAESGCGIVIPPESPEALADAIEKIASMSCEERWAMGMRGRKFVEQNHNFNRLGQQLEDLLLRTAEAHGTYTGGHERALG